MTYLQQPEPIDLRWLKDKEICSLCAIGDPQSFEKMLANLGAHVQKNFRFMDHHWYTRKEISSIIDFCQAQQVKYLVTTFKDVVKLGDYTDLFRDVKLLVLHINIAIIQGENEVFHKIDQLLLG